MIKAYRIRKIQDLTGLNLADLDDPLGLRLSLLLRRLAPEQFAATAWPRAQA